MSCPLQAGKTFSGYHVPRHILFNYDDNYIDQCKFVSNLHPGVLSLDPAAAAAGKTTTCIKEEKLLEIIKELKIN